MHRLLVRQLRKAFPDGTPSQIERFLELVDAAYEAADDDRKLLERAMELAGDELLERNEELAARVHELEEVQQELGETDRWRRDFINSAAHELSTPLTPLKLQMRTMALGTDPDRLERSMGVLTRNIDRLAMLVSDLVDAAKLQSDHIALQPRPTDLVRLAERAVEAMTPVASDKGVRLHASLPQAAMVEADPGRIEQVMDNLLSNAIKFTPKGGEVEVRIEDGEQVKIIVRDTGIGIDGSGLRMLFKPFTQVHDAAEVSDRGTGLGLYVSHGLMHASGGALEAYSDGPGQGAVFTASLPSLDSQTAAP